MPGGICKVKELSLIMMCIKPENYQPLLPPAVIVHALAHVRLAMAAGRPVTLLSAAGVACNWGCLWWQSLLAAAHYTGPALLDCGAAPGRAIEALELGVGGIVLSPGPVWADVAALALQKRSLLLASPPPALDLGQKRHERGLVAWLNG